MGDTTNNCCDEDDEVTSWEDEARAVIRDVSDHIDSAHISKALVSTESCIYLNITTLEGRRLTVRLSCRGFAIVCSDGHDVDEVVGAGTGGDGVEESSKENLQYHETIYSLLNTVSPAYTDSFGKALAAKLSQLNQ